MELTRKVKEELETRIDRIEDFISKKGVGSKYLQKAHKTQRDINLTLVLCGILTVAGLALWMTSKDK